MKEFQVKNIKDVSPQIIKRDGNEFQVKSVFETGLLKKCAAAFVEVAPGNFAYGYHYHETVEEIFYIISGEGSVRTIKGEIPVKAGDVISFPTGEGGAHMISNASSTEPLIYIDFGTRGECEIAHFPDTNKIMVISKTTQGMFDNPAS